MIYFARKHDCEACALKPSAAQTRLHEDRPLHSRSCEFRGNPAGIPI